MSILCCKEIKHPPPHPMTSHLSPKRLQSVLQTLASVNPPNVPGREPEVLQTTLRHRDRRPLGRSHTAKQWQGQGKVWDALHPLNDFARAISIRAL